MGEHRLYGELTKASERYGSEVYRKIRVADVVDIELLSTRELGSFALKAHFDFVVSTTLHVPEFALEFDDLGHIGTKDDTKDQICREAGLTLFRVRDSIQRARFQKLHFAGYLVHFWHHALEFKRMKEFGEVAPYEPFMMSSFIREDAKHIFDSEWNFLGMGQAKYQRLMRDRGREFWQVSHLDLEHVVPVGPSNNFCAMVATKIDSQPYVGRAKLELSVPSVGKFDGFEKALWELGEFCLGMAFDDLITEINDPSEQSLIPETSIEIVRQLLGKGFIMCMGSGSPGGGFGLLDAGR